jgi:hypothetical protein
LIKLLDRTKRERESHLIMVLKKAALRWQRDRICSCQLDAEGRENLQLQVSRCISAVYLRRGMDSRSKSQSMVECIGRLASLLYSSL